MGLARLRSPILNELSAGLPESRLSTIWEFPFSPGLVLARPELPGLFILNQTASVLWSLRKSGLSVSALVDSFRNAFGLNLARAQADVSAALSYWEEHFLSPVPPPPFQDLAFPARWHAAEIYLVNNHVVRILLSDPDLAAEISPRLETLHCASDREPDLQFEVWPQNGRVLLTHQAELIFTDENPNAVRAVLLQEMVRRTEPGREWLAVLHAGACGTPTSCVLLAGQSQSGKTTLAAALMAAGFTFYCDDSAAISRDGTVSVMPFRMMLREGSWNVLSLHFPEIASTPVLQRYGHHVRFLSPRPGRIARAPGLPKALLFISYSPGERTSMRPLLPFETLLHLQGSGFWVQHDHASIAAFLEWLALLPAFEFTYSDLDDAIAEIRGLCAR